MRLAPLVRLVRPFCDHPPDLPQGKTEIGAGAPLAREALSDERRQTITLLDVWTSCSRRDYGQTTRGGQNNFVTVDDSKENEGQREYSGNCRAAHDSSNGGVARDQNIFRMGDVCAGGRGRKRIVGRRT